MSEDPFDIETHLGHLWRSTMHYGRMGVTMNAISGVDLALWDIIGKALGLPVYKLIGGAEKHRMPAYCTGNDIDQHVEFGFKRLKLAIPYGPADGREGMRKNVELVKRARAALGPDGDIMLDCWMAWTERYTLEMAELLEPYRVYWMEEVLQPHDYAGLRTAATPSNSTRIATGEHEYGRYGFRNLLEHNAAAIWQPDIHWCGGLTEMRRDRRAGSGVRHPGDSARRRDFAGRPALDHGHRQQALGGDVHAGARRTEGGLQEIRRGIPGDSRPRGNLCGAVGPPRFRLGFRGGVTRRCPNRPVSNVIVVATEGTDEIHVDELRG